MMKQFLEPYNNCWKMSKLSQDWIIRPVLKKGDLHIYYCLINYAVSSLGNIAPNAMMTMNNSLEGIRKENLKIERKTIW
jgi:hypothetical protein